MPRLSFPRGISLQGLIGRVFLQETAGLENPACFYPTYFPMIRSNLALASYEIASGAVIIALFIAVEQGQLRSGWVLPTASLMIFFEVSTFLFSTSRIASAVTAASSGRQQS